MDKVIDLAVIGAGPAGMSAALAAAGAGIEVEIFDSLPLPGGQYFRHHPESKLSLSGRKMGLADFKSQLSDLGVSVDCTVLVWDLHQDENMNQFDLFLQNDDKKCERVRAKKVIVAAGAFERVLPFKGWTLPGVMTTGAAWIMGSVPGVLERKRVVVYGSGPLLWPAVERLVSSGASVIAVLEWNPFPWEGYRLIPYIWQQSDRLKEGWSYLRLFQGQQIPFHWDAEIQTAVGDRTLEAIAFSRAKGKRIQTLPVDYLFTGFGLRPSVQLLQVAGAGLDCDSLMGQIPVRDPLLQTTVPGLFAVGDGVMTMGKDAAALEGKLAGLSAAQQLNSRVDLVHIEQVKKALKKEMRFTHLLMEIFPFPFTALQTVADSTVLCRCEEITFGEIRKWMKLGVNDANNMKALTRIGMGHCQGRFCSSNLVDLLRGGNQDVKRKLTASKTPVAARPPVMPVPLKAFLDDEVQNDA